MIVLALPVGAQFIGYLLGCPRSCSRIRNSARNQAPWGNSSNWQRLSCCWCRVCTGCRCWHWTDCFTDPTWAPAAAADGADIVVRAVTTSFSLALQLASPFVVIGIVWHIAMGLVARMVSRMQIYFVAMPGQIMAGLALLMMTGSAILLAWRDGAQAAFIALPGGG